MLIAQSGGANCAVNASLAGAIIEAGKHPELIEEIYGGLNGVRGVLDERLIDLQEEKQQTILALRFSPAAALGTTRYRIDPAADADQAARDLDRLFQVFEAHNIRYFFCTGGRPCQAMLHRIDEEARRRGFELRVIGIPTSMDNTLPHTDHSPGYGSVVKCCATAVLEVGRDAASGADGEGQCCFVEVRGGNAGWVAGGTALARRGSHEAPHLILMPEAPVSPEALQERIRATVAELGYCVGVVADGVQPDAWGFPALAQTPPDGAGAAGYFAQFTRQQLGLSVSSLALGDRPRSGAHLASAKDVAEAFDCGRDAVLSAINGQTGFVVRLVRESNAPYKVTIGLHSLADVANMQNLVPREWVSEDGLMPNDHFLNYVRPLIQGEADLNIEGGLPIYPLLEKVAVEPKLPPRE